MITICADLQKNYGMDFGKMVFKFHFRTPHAELHYVPNFQPPVIFPVLRDYGSEKDFQACYLY